MYDKGLRLIQLPPLRCSPEEHGPDPPNRATAQDYQAWRRQPHRGPDTVNSPVYKQQPPSQTITDAAEKPLPTPRAHTQPGEASPVAPARPRGCPNGAHAAPQAAGSGERLPPVGRSTHYRTPGTSTQRPPSCPSPPHQATNHQQPPLSAGAEQGAGSDPCLTDSYLG